MTAALLPADDHAPRSHGAFPGAPVGSVDGTTIRRRPYLVPVPDCEPPFDDEIGRCPHHGRTDCAATGPTPPRFEVRHGSWHAPGRTPLQDRPIGGATHPGSSPVVPFPVEPDPVGPGRGVPATLTAPAARTAAPARPAAGSADHSARLLARALIEVLAGHRPPTQLRTFCTPAIFATLYRQGRRPSPALPHVLSVRVCEPADGVAEVAAVFRRGDRVRMVAFRLERCTDPTAPAGDRWTITAVQPG